ncbi:Hypothetical predicted protein [Xyrichtys novacula]|uniref:Uncharacterized protein n=1 Tax=Xyrichtys novacula TaxID=13765 RepID=A0AAV1EHR9_XYRNO|nr:Hypothetical predicted protein [Xyrichtys novacula]
MDEVYFVSAAYGFQPGVKVAEAAETLIPMCQSGSWAGDKDGLSTANEEIKKDNKISLGELRLSPGYVTCANMNDNFSDGWWKGSDDAGKLVEDMDSCGTRNTVGDCIEKTDIPYQRVPDDKHRWRKKRSWGRRLNQVFGNKRSGG